MACKTTFPSSRSHRISPRTTRLHLLFHPSEQTFDRGEHPRFICEHKLYWGAFSDPQEADYVTAVLNSDTAAVRQTRF
jgi:hypothetical protein